MAALIDAVTLSKKRCETPIRCELKYATNDNFVGRLIDGYDENAKHLCFLTEMASVSLCDVQNYLVSKYSYGLLVYDAYRPRRAVVDFMNWVKQPPDNQYELDQKAKHYPQLEKPQLFELGYLAGDSEHCYANTVDAVLVDANSGSLLDMGTCFDFMGEASHATATEKEIGKQAFQYRRILSQAMQEFGFVPYPKEYWHFSNPRAIEVDAPIDIPIKAGKTIIGI